MKLFSRETLLAAVLVCAVAVLPWLPTHRPSRHSSIEIELCNTAEGCLQVYLDAGAGFPATPTAQVGLARNSSFIRVRCPLPGGDCRALRVVPLDTAATVRIRRAALLRSHGRPLQPIPLDRFHADPAAPPPLFENDELTWTAGTDRAPTGLVVEFSPVLHLEPSWLDRLCDWALCTLGAWVLLGGFLLTLDRAPRARAALLAAARRIVARPGRAVLVVAAAAAILSAYPVAFFGKSFVSPYMGTPLLYDGVVTLPLERQTPSGVNVQGSDVGAIMWQQVPYTVVIGRALERDHEWPLWNRYNSSGVPLLGQGQTMFGDPLQGLVAAADGAAWAWDIKYIAAKWLFAAALGLLVLAVAGGHLPAALLVSGAAPFMGFFLFRLNHPAFFSLCYAPAVLYAWVRIARADSRRATAGWAAALALANWMLLHSGTIKEAYALTICLNPTGALMLFSTSAPARTRWLKFAVAAWACAVTALLYAPDFLLFLGELTHAYTSSTLPSAHQLPPSLALAVFDEVFYRPLTQDLLVFNPSANFLVLLGLLYFVVTLPTQLADRPIAALALASLPPLALAFRIVPAAWILPLPFLGQISHLDNTFTCVLLVLWSVLAGAGFAAAASRLHTPVGRRDLALAALLLAAMVGAYLFVDPGHVRPTGTLRSFAGGMHPTPFVWASLAALVAALLGFALVVRHARRRGRFAPAHILLALLCLGTMLWRFGQHKEVNIDTYTLRLANRADFHAPSRAVSFLQEAQREAPSRSIGFARFFFPGWTGFYGLEGINGPDAVMDPAYRELTFASPLGREWDWRLSLDRTQVTATRPFLDFLNVRHYLDRSSPAEASPIDGLRLVLPADLAVYESPTVWPRAFFTDRLALYETTPQLMQRILAGDGRPFAAARRADLAASASPTVTLPGDLAARTVVAARSYRCTANRTAFEVTATGPGLVVLGEAGRPEDFLASVNGQPAAIVRINHAFKAVFVPAAGEYRVEFRYRPRRFQLGLALAALGLVLGAGSLGLALRRPADSAAR